MVRQISVRNNVSVSRTRQIPPQAGKGVPGHGCRRRTNGQLKNLGVEANSTDSGRHRSYGTQMGCCASEYAMFAAMGRKILPQCSFRSSAQTGSSRVGVSDVDPRTVPRLAVGGSGHGLATSVEPQTQQMRAPAHKNDVIRITIWLLSGRMGTSRKDAADLQK